MPVDIGARCGVCAAGGFERALRDNSRSPISDSSAGVSVTATSTATATHAAPTIPISPRKGMPVIVSATSAITTVKPANTTALPDVPVASAIDSRSGTPARSCLR